MEDEGSREEGVKGEECEEKEMVFLVKIEWTEKMNKVNENIKY